VDKKSRIEEVCYRYFELLKANHNSDEAQVRVADEMGLKHDSVRRYISFGRDIYLSHKQSDDDTRQIDGAILRSPKLLDKKSSSDIWNDAKNRNEINIWNEQRQRNIEIEFTDYLPIGLAWIADHHFDDPRADIARAEVDAKTVRNVSGLYCASGGDELNNFIKQLSKFPKFDDVQQPVKERFELFRHWLDMVFLKMLFMTDGNHNYYFYSASGLLLEHHIAEEHGVHCSKDYISPRLIVGDQSYLGFAAHTFWGRSRLNPTHEILRAARHNPGNEKPDFVCVGHRHDNFAGVFQIDGHSVAGIKSGSYKYNSADFEGQASIPNSIPFMPMMIFLPDRKQIIPLNDIETGAEILTNLRETYRKGDSVEAAN
jgi:hypothetical protein